MPTALIGHGGFIGQNLDAQAHFEVKADATLAPGNYDLVVCAAAPGEKWRANREPDVDAAAVQRLVDSLQHVEARRFALISTLDVYPKPEMVDEDSAIDAAEATAFGRHRRMLEEFCLRRFPATVVRLPLLFGPGLNHNVLFDLLIDHQVENIHPDGVFQFYAAAHLWRDLNIALERGLPVLNVATEPVPTRELALRCFGRELTSYPSAQPAVYDVRSKHAPLWGGQPFGYLYSKERVLQEISDFVEKERAL
ncbi:MAG TPA: NAD-dependent epimerase/dehydratase family protein [Myxococcales bacterium]|nr:NAD-dependent epimerase/dehydratase family protein [Myxococcales bacterium]